MKWIEVKMRELGVSTHEQYKLTFMLDHMAMVTVHHEKHGALLCRSEGGQRGLYHRRVRRPFMQGGGVGLLHVLRVLPVPQVGPHPRPRGEQRRPPTAPPCAPCLRRV